MEFDGYYLPFTIFPFYASPDMCLEKSSNEVKREETGAWKRASFIFSLCENFSTPNPEFSFLPID